KHRKNWLGFLVVVGVFALLALFIVAGGKKDLIWAFLAALVLLAITPAAAPKLEFDQPFAITSLGLMSVVYDIGDFMWYAGALLAVSLLMILLSPNEEWKAKWRLSTMMALVALLGFSSYAYVPIRSSVNPNIDENEPRTLAT